MNNQKEQVIDITETIDFGSPQEKLERIKKSLQPKLQQIKEKVDANEKRMYPQKLNFIGIINNYIDTEVRKGDRIKYNEAISIDYITLKGFYDCWFDLMGFVRDYYPEYFANKQLFSGFCGFSTQAFDYLCNSPDGDIIALMNSLVDSMVDGNFVAGQSGTVSGSMTTSRLKAGGNAGYDVRIKNDSEQTQTNNFLVLNNDSVLKKLKNIGFSGK